MYAIPMKVHSKDLKMSEIENTSYFVYHQPLKILPWTEILISFYV